MNKRKLFTLALSICMIAILAVGGTLAYMFDTDHQVNVFTAGKVGINLDEAKVVQDEKDNWVADGNERIDAEVKDDDDITQTYDLHPNMTVFKDPTITVDKDSKPTYVGAKVTVTGDIHSLIGVDGGYDNIDITKLASGGLMDDSYEMWTPWNDFGFVYGSHEKKCAIYQIADKKNNTWELYIFMLQPMNAGESVTLFDTLTIPASYTNADMAKLNGMKIDVKAYGVQADGFDYLDKDVAADEMWGSRACFVALNEAFEEWPGNSGFVDGGVNDVLRVEK